MGLDDEGRLILCGVIIGLIIGASIGSLCTFAKMSEGTMGRDLSRNGLWQEAVVRGYADELEAEDGKPAYRWKER